MIDRIYRQLEEEMCLQVQEGKKDRYIAITEALTSIDLTQAEPAEKLDYLDSLNHVLEVMDFQIYELYYRILEKFREGMKEMIALADHFRKSAEKKIKELSEEEKAFSLQVRALFEKGCRNGYLVREHFVFFDQGVDYTEKKALPFVKDVNLSLHLLQKTARCATILLEEAGRYETDQPYQLYLNGQKKQMVTTSVSTVFQLMPDTDYEIAVLSEDESRFGCVTIHTDFESVTVNVRDFGAKGDGESDDTSFLQAAVLSCPEQGRVLIPEGIYRFTSLFMKSNVNIELAAGACLKAIPDRYRYSIQPGAIPSSDGKDEYHFGTWEGNPLPIFTGVLMGYDVKNAAVYGEGTLDGSASHENWWKTPKALDIAYRPKLVFLNHCEHVKLIGFTLKNSPCWTMHPFFSDHLGFYNLTVNNPAVSPNTDGLDPESCFDVEIAGIKFSLGDDCIAVKSGKIYMGRKYKKPSEKIRIHHCLMEKGHGAVTLGSELAGGVVDLSVEDCDFSHTDRGLRIKSRRGRGKDAIIDQIAFRRIKMDHVMTPFVCNSFYFCDPDGKTEYVQSREVYPVDERTPVVRKLIFEEIDARNCHVAAAFLEGLPERKIEEIVFRNVTIDFCEDAKTDVPAMTNGVEACSRRGIFAKNVDKLVLDHVTVSGVIGETMELQGVNTLERKEDE